MGKPGMWDFLCSQKELSCAESALGLELGARNLISMHHVCLLQNHEIREIIETSTLINTNLNLFAHFKILDFSAVRENGQLLVLSNFSRPKSVRMNEHIEHLQLA